MKSRFVFVSVPLFLLATLVAAETQPAPVTVKYTQGRRGYQGVQSTWLMKHLPAYAVNRDDLMIGRLVNDPNKEWRTLLRFTGLDIPAGAEIRSARLTLLCGGLYGAPQIGVFGLLRDFTDPKTHWNPAAPGETNWTSQHEGQRAWGKPGADLGCDAFQYDGEADRLSNPDSVAAPTSNGYVNFDVTASFADQFQRGKPYGWILIETTGKIETYANFLEEKAELVVTYLPPSADLAVPAEPPRPVLINFCLAEPMNMAANLKRVRELPFEGTVFFGEGNDRTDRLWIANSVFGPDRLDYANYTQFIQAARELAEKTPMKHNFLRVNTCVPGTLEKRDQPYTWDTRPRNDQPIRMWWADGFDSVVANIKVAARVARASGGKGLLIDGEQYGGDLWGFEHQKDAHTLGKTLEATQAQVRKRAEMLARAMTQEFPDLTIIMIFYAYNDRPEMLWNAFTDGLFAGIGPPARLAAANECGYQLLSQKEFKKEYDWDYLTAPKFSQHPQKYLKQVEVGFGVWLDANGWSKNPEVNGSAALWQVKLENALTVADSYVWVYTGGSGHLTPNWWTGEHLPDAYLDATRKALDLIKQRSRR